MRRKPLSSKRPSREKHENQDAATSPKPGSTPKRSLQRISLYAASIQRAIEKTRAELDALRAARKAAYAKAEEAAILLSKLAPSKGWSFDPATDFPGSGNFGGFAYSDHELAQVIAIASKRPAPASPPKPDLTLRDPDGRLIG